METHKHYQRAHGYLFLAIAALYPAWGYLFLKLYPEIIENVRLRWAVSAGCMAAGVVCLLPSRVASPDIIRRLVQSTVFAVTMAYMHVLAVNKFELTVIPGMFIISAASAFVLFERRALLTYATFVTVSVAAYLPSLISDPEFHARNLIYFICGFWTVAVFYALAAGTAEQMEEEIRRQKALQLQMKKWSEIGQLAGGVVHELASPINALRLYVDDLSESSGRAHVPEPIERTFTRIQEIMHSLRAVSYQSQSSAFSAVDLPSLIRETVPAFTPQLNRIGATLDLDIGKDLRIWGRETPVVQILTNLICNALDAVESCPVRKIRVSAQETGGLVILRIADSGVGIDSKCLERIFEPYFTTKCFGQGIGLGLPTVKKLVEEMNGQVEVRSPAAGGWSTEFEVHFPIKNELG